MYFSAENPKTVVTVSKQGGGTADYNNISLGLFLINLVYLDFLKLCMSENRTTEILRGAKAQVYNVSNNWKPKNCFNFIKAGWWNSCLQQH